MKRTMVEILLSALVLVIAWLSVDSWVASRDAQRRFATAVAAQQQLIAEADAREHEQQNNLKNLLKEIADLKSKTRTPFQVINELPKYLPLPKPITIASTQQIGCAEQSQCSLVPHTQNTRERTHKTLTDPHSLAAGPSTLSASGLESAGNLAAKLPLQDLKPLFDFVQDCRTCNADLDSTRNKEIDDSVKMAALTREMDLAARAEKGSLWRRIRHDVVLFAFGAMAGYAAVR